MKRRGFGRHFRLDFFLFDIADFFRFRFGRQFFQRGENEAFLPLQIARHDEILRRMRFQPARAAPQQFFDFLFADVIVFVVVHYRQQNIKMRQGFAQLFDGAKLEAHERRLAPGGKTGVEREFFDLDLVAERLEQLARGFLAARRAFDLDFKRNFARREFASVPCKRR